MEVYILTEGGKNIGFGHVSRCSSIYEAFKLRNIIPNFIINGDNSVKSILEDIEVKLINWLEDTTFLTNDDVVIIDSYLADLDFFKKISAKVALVVYLDDNNRFEYPKGIVVNGLINADKLDYPKNEDIKYLLGFKFAPLRSDFWEIPKLKINNEIKDILITTGGNDIRNLTPKLLNFFNDFDFRKKVIIADSFQNVDEIESLKNASVELIYSPNACEILDVMSNVDLAISASGQTLYELAAVGVPTIAIGIIENQKDNIKNFTEIGFIEYAGCWNDKDLFEKILEKIEYLKDKNIRHDKKLNGILAIDGCGSKRIVREILKEYYINNSVFREITSDDCLKIFKLANDSDVRQNSFNSDKIPLEDHKVWFKNILNSNLTKFYVMDYEGDIIGQLRFDFDEEYPVISISLNKKYRGLGLSKYLLDEGIKSIGYNKVVAYIKKDNEASISLFNSMGFIKVDEVKIKNCESFKFIRG